MKTANRTKRPRLGSLGDQLGAIREYLFRAESDGPTTNWSIEPANDNEPLPASNIEMAVELTPLPEEIMRKLKGVDLVERREPSMLAGGRLEHRRAKREIHSRPVRQDVERCPFTGETLRTVLGPYTFNATGVMDGCRERSTRAKGGATRVLTNAQVAAFVAAKVPEHQPRAKQRRTAPVGYVTLTKAQARSALKRHGVDGSVPFDEARYNAGLDYVMRDSRPVMPAGSSLIGNIFVSQLKAPPKGGTVDVWATMYGAMRDADERKGHAHLSRRDRTVLKALETARTLSDVGTALGHQGRHAKKAGRAALVAANENLERGCRKLAA